MSFQLFNAYVTKNRIVPTNEQKNFFNHRLILLDPNNSGKIAGKTVIDFFRMAGLNKSQIKEIWSISNPNQNQFLTYEDMQVAIRLISYAQSGIQLSKQNVELNIKCNLPVLFDEDDQDQRPTNKIVVNQPVQPKQLFSDRDIQQYQKLWNSLNGKHNEFISGNEVKKLYQTAANKSSLSDAWKLCSNTEKGYLSKGQLFIFIHLIKLLKENLPLPSTLNQQMKQVITKFDKHIVEKRKSGQQQKDINLQNNNSLALNVQNKLQLPNEKMQALQKKMKDSTNNKSLQLQQLSKLSNQNTLNNFITDVENYIKQIQSKNALYEKEINLLKQQQTQTSDRLNSSVLRLKKIIQKQNIFIQQLIGQIKTKQEIDAARIKSLESVPDKNYQKPVVIPDNQRNKPSQIPIEKANQPKPEIPSRQSIKSIQQSKKQQQSQINPSPGQSQVQQQLLPHHLQVLQLLHAVRPISQHQMPQIKQQIVAMPIQQLQQLYKNLVQRYQQQQQKLAENNSQYISKVQQVKPQKQKQIEPPINQTKQNTPQKKQIMKQEQKLQMVENVFGAVLSNVQFNFDDFKKQEYKHPDTEEVDFWKD